MREFGSSFKAVHALRSMSCFAGLEPATFEFIARASVQQTYDADQIVFLVEEPCRGLYIVQDGWLKECKRSHTGREQVIRFLGPGDVFNEAGALAEGKNLLTVQALEPCTVWIIQREALLQMLDASPQLCRLFTQNLAKQVHHMLNLIEDLSLRTVEGRLARFLLDQSREQETRRQKPVTQAEIAVQLGTVPSVINRTLHRLADGGAIRIERDGILILNSQELETKAFVG